MSWVVSALGKWVELERIQEGLSESASVVRVDGATDPVKALVAAALARDMQHSTLVISPTGDSAERFYDHLIALTGDGGPVDDERVVLIPSLEGLLYEDIAPDPTLVGRRLRALRALLTGEPRLFVASPGAVFQRSIPPHEFDPAFLTLQVNETIDREAILTRLVALGYEREDMADAPGEVSARGGILDIFPAGDEDPVRIELFGDEIESIRRFDATTQRSFEPIESVTILPAREILLTEDAIAEAIPKIEDALKVGCNLLRSAGKDSEAIRLEDHIREVVVALRQQSYLGAVEYFLPFFYPKATALDYLSEKTLIVMDEPERIPERYADTLRDLLELQAARVNQGLLLPLFESLHVPLDEAKPLLDEFRTIEMSLFGSSTGARQCMRIEASSQPMEGFAGDIPRLAMALTRWQEQRQQVLVATRQGDRLVELLDEAGIGAMVREQPDVEPKAGQIVISHRPLNEGFKLPDAGIVALTDRDIFGWRRVRRPSKKRPAEGVPIGSLTDLAAGDYVVHINHGIGIYRGLVRRGPDDTGREYLLVEYADNDRLYVPIEQFDRVQKYLGGEENRPQVHRLGGSEWERTKRRAQKSAAKMAGELTRLYAARQNQDGHAFGPDTPWQREMEDGFSYEETPDQITAISAVKQDMETARPMDRLICGDVGYGKTEVAIRAAFKSVMDGKQVAVLVPTTVLAQQHYTTFKERLSPYPVRVEMLSRFRSRKERDEVVQDLEAGAVDIVVGTHRLLSKDVAFKDIGLVIVDEEQRFGVRHKETLKQLRATVDVVTMTATPIPRTLHMALSGIRDMSVINDPPEGRTAVITRTLPREDDIVREAILRELERGGQVYLVHNRVESISHVAHHVQQLLPNARIVVAHGQMNERQLERAMIQFYSGEAHILVCTTIIENGLDIPNANTLIVTDADKLGLAQLYQLRGRVGRSTRQAYAYLMWTPFKRLTETAEKRIAAIREFSELGSGFQIALRDLEIRGAGNILGPEQHGFVASVGFELYMQMLADAVKQAQGEVSTARPQVSVDLPVPAYLPEEYAPDRNQRIDLYRRLASAPDRDRLNRISEEVADRFGRPLPDPVDSLVRLSEIKILCAKAGVRRISMEGNLSVLFLADNRRLSTSMTRMLRRELPAEVRIWVAMMNHDRVVVSLRNADTEAVFARLEPVLSTLASLPLEEEALRHQRREKLSARR